MKPIRVSSKLSQPVQDLLTSMLQMNPSDRAPIDDILSNSLFAKYTNPAIPSPLTVSEYGFLLKCYINNTHGVTHLHLPQELSRLRSMHRLTITSNNGCLEKPMAGDGSTQATVTIDSDLPSQLPPLELRESFRESLSDLLFDPANEECTLFEFPMDFNEDKTGEFDSRMRDSISRDINLTSDVPFEVDFPSEYLTSWSLQFDQLPSDPLTSQLTAIPWPVMTPEPRRVSPGKSELNPRVISIKRKQSIGMSDYE